jgi:hypothetical protein
MRRALQDIFQAAGTIDYPGKSIRHHGHHGADGSQQKRRSNGQLDNVRHDPYITQLIQRKSPRNIPLPQHQ